MIDDNATQSSKIWLPIFETAVGMNTSVKTKHALKAFIPIEVTAFGIAILCSVLQN